MNGNYRKAIAGEIMLKVAKGIRIGFKSEPSLVTLDPMEYLSNHLQRLMSKLEEYEQNNTELMDRLSVIESKVGIIHKD